MSISSHKEQKQSQCTPKFSRTPKFSPMSRPCLDDADTPPGADYFRPIHQSLPTRRDSLYELGSRESAILGHKHGTHTR